MTRSRADSEDSSLDSWQVQEIFLFQKASIILGVQPRSYSYNKGSFFWWRYCGWGVKLVSHTSVAPRLRMSGNNEWKL